VPFVTPEDPLAGVDAPLWRAITTVDLRQLPVTRRWKVEFELLTTLGWAPDGDTPPEPGATWDLADVPHRAPSGMTTDLASVPFFLWGVIASYGRQTLPALVHDRLCALAKDERGPRRRRLRREADRLFRTTLAASGSGLLRRWLMWSAVRLFGLPTVAVPYAVAALALTVWALTGVGWAPTVALVAAGVAALACLWAAVEERPGGGVRWRPWSVVSLLGAAAVATIPAVPIVVLGLATVLAELVIGLGERSMPSVRPATAGPEAPVARIEWQPLVSQEELPQRTP
jgi:hypothetical protein